MTDSVLLIQGGRVLDPGQGIDQLGDVLLQEGVVSWVAPAGHRNPAPQGCDVLDARGLVVCPGFIDLHTHLREPGFEQKETIATGAGAAARGGFTTICAMPNTDPPLDNAALVQLVLRRAQEAALVRVLPIACVTAGRAGKALTEMAELAEAGAIGFSDDGDPVADPFLMRMALTYSAPLGLPVINHCEEPSLARRSVVNEGWVASRLGLRGMPAAAEECMVARDIELAALTGGRLHLAHLSTAGSVDLVRRAKERGLRVTAEVTPHHLLLTEDWVMGGPRDGELESHETDAWAPLAPDSYDTNAKVNPPLRTRRDVEAVVQGLREGVLDIIATDHAPHSAVDKVCTFDDAASGISGLETALGLLMALVRRGDLALETLVQRLTADPARVLGPQWSHLGSLRPGAAADVTVFDPGATWTVEPERLTSRGRNTPLAGVTLRGRVVATAVGGRLVYLAEDRAETRSSRA